MGTTTVKIRDETKSSLDEIKVESETYDEVINRIIFAVKKRNLKNELVEGYTAVGKDDLDTLEEWESASADTN